MSVRNHTSSRSIARTQIYDCLWLINYHMAERQREACYAVLFEMLVCYGEGEVSQREVT